MLGTARPGLTPATLADLLARTRSLTDKPFGVNFIVAPIFLTGSAMRPPLDLKCIEIAARAAKVIEFFYGEPERRFVEMAHGGGALACWQIGSREEAVAAARAGCDFVVAQGIEAGGHVRGTIPMMTLLREVISAVDLPVLAAGGIGTGEAMAVALAAGADGVRVGTRFVAAAEAAAHPEYVAALIGAEAEDTAYCNVFPPPGRTRRTAFCARASRQPKASRAIRSARRAAWMGRECRSFASRVASPTGRRPERSARWRCGRESRSVRSSVSNPRPKLCRSWLSKRNGAGCMKRGPPSKRRFRSHGHHQPLLNTCVP